MNTNRSSDCPACHKEPHHAKDNSQDVIECHGYIATGSSLREAADHWQTLIDHCLAILHQKPVYTPPPLETASPCFNCHKDTPGALHTEPQRFWVVCRDCLMVKYEGRA